MELILKEWERHYTNPSIERIKFENQYNITEIMPGIFLGNAHAALDRRLLNYLGITKILNITSKGEVPCPFPEKTYYRCIARDNYEGGPVVLKHLGNMINFINSAYGRTGVLIHCRMGRSRSASVVIAWMMNRYGITWNKAYQYVKHKRDQINPNPGIKIGVKQYFFVKNNF